MENREAYIALNSLSGIGPIRVAQMLTVCGEPRAVLAASEGELARIPGIGAHLAALVSHWREHVDLDAELDLARRAGVAIFTREDEEYPPLLRDIHDPPLCLYVRGAADALTRTRQSLAIVGSRHTTAYGVKMAETLAAGAALAGWVVVSGLARGIDTVAHESVVKVRGCTIAVLGSGLAHLYPQENIALAKAIVDTGGALVSEFPMRFPPDKRAFPMRNRLISGMTLGTVVVEAGEKSGSLITAGQALEQGREVFAVPGRVDSPQSRGCHALIKDGAKLVEDIADVLVEFEGVLRFHGTAPATASAGLASADTDGDPAPSCSDLQVSDLERQLLGFLETNREAAIDDLVVAIGAPVSKVLGALVMLEMRHIVTQLPGKRVTLRTTRG